VVWVEAELYESELPHIQVGSEALVALSHSPHEPLKGTVSYIYPYLDPRTRRGRVRIEVPNPAGLLKPDMYANVQIHLPLGERLAIPQDAILYAGESRVVFVDLGGGRMKPQWITTGSRAGEWIEVLAGLEEGEKIVTSGNFFIAAESRLKSGIEKW
jgi:membrane fusion protein, copper/silver efflux system